MPIYYSDFNDPSELNNYYYNNDDYRGVQITNGYLEVYLGLYGKNLPDTMTCSAVYKKPFPSGGIRIKARVSAFGSSDMTGRSDMVNGIKIQSASGFNPSDPTSSNRQIHFGFSTPYLTVVYVKGYTPERVYQSGDWLGPDTGWHELEVDLYADRIEFYFDGQLVYTLNSNPFNGDQVYVGIVASYYEVGDQSGAYTRADYLEVDQMGTVIDAIAYPSLTAQPTIIYTPADTTAYSSLSITPTYTPIDTTAYSSMATQQTYIYTPVDTMAYPSLSTQQTYTPPTPVYTPVDTLAYTNLTIPQVYVSPPTPTPTTPLPSVSGFYLLLFILFFLMMLALSRRRS